jgi:succinate dehydrogenase cytochrome b subunit
MPMEKSQRPLSPHLQIYRPQLTSVLSITHRATGIALVAGTLVLVYWLLAVASGAEAYASAQYLLGSWLGRVVLLGFSFALFYHLCNGIRHLFWDVGLGFELKTAYASGIAVVIVSIVMTAIAWGLAYAMRGGI